MRYILFFFTCLTLGALSAETIGKVQYELPNQGKGWKKANELKGDGKIKSFTIIYIPENEDLSNAHESFGAHVDSISSTPPDKKTIEKTIKKQFPNQQVKVNILESAPQSVLYESILSEEGKERIHGWTRLFSNSEGTILLIYQTDQIDQVNNLRPIWVKTLMNAKFKD